MHINVRKSIFVLINILLVILQVTLFSDLKIGWIGINFALITVVYTALFTDDWLFCINAFIVGICYDNFSYRETGFFTLLFLVIAVIVKLFSRMVNRYGFITALVIILAATFLSEFFVYWSHFILKGIEYNSFVFVNIILPQCLVNTAAAAVLFWLYLWLIKLLDIKNFRR